MELLIKYLKRESSLLNDILICIAALLTCYFYYYEDNSRIIAFDSINDYVKLGIGLLTVIVWLVILVENAYKKRISFGIFTALVWILPQVVYFLFNTFDDGIYESGFTMYLSVILQLVSDIFIVGMSKIAAYIPINVILVVYAVAFITVFIYAHKRRN